MRHRRQAAAWAGRAQGDHPEEERTMKLDWAAGLSGTTGPFATVSVDASRDEPDAAREIELRWQAHARRLADLGAPDAVVKALGEAVTAPHGRAGDVGQLLVATADGIALDLVLPRPPVRESASWGPVPQLLPAVRALNGRLSYVLAEVDSAGGAIHVVTPWGEAASEEVRGDHDVLHRVPGGGWSHRRYQRRVEDSVARNADEVARALAAIVREHRPDLVLVGGEEKAVTDLLDQSPGEVTGRVHRVHRGSRAPGAGNEARDAEVAELVARHARERRAAVLDRFTGAEARQEAAAQSLPDVVAALQRGQVDELLLVDDPSSDLTLWATGVPEQLALDRDELGAMGAGTGERARADAAIVWAVAGTGAGITLFARDPEDPRHDPDADGEAEPRLRDGIGAVLRWFDESTPRDGAPSMPGHGEPPGERHERRPPA
jgi:hypothetical protein